MNRSDPAACPWPAASWDTGSREPIPAPSVQRARATTSAPKRSAARSRHKTKQPKMRQSRFSVEAMMDAPDTTASRPGLRLRVTGLIVAGLFALLGLRLWTLQVLQAPAAAQAVAADQIRAVPVDPTRGLILDRYGNPLVNNVVTEQITLSRLTAQQDPAVVGRLAALIGADHRPGGRHHRRQAVQPVQAGAGAVERPPWPTSSTSKSTRTSSPGCPRWPPPSATTRSWRCPVPPRWVSGGPGPRLRGDHQQHRAGVADGAGVPGRGRLRPIRARVPVRVRAAGHPRAAAAGGEPRGAGGREPSRRPRPRRATTW